MILKVVQSLLSQLRVVTPPRVYFDELFGFPEVSHQVNGAFELTQAQFNYDFRTCILESKANGRRFSAGRFMTPSLQELRTSKPTFRFFATLPLYYRYVSIAITWTFELLFYCSR
jgi:hypothetical protein